MVRSTPRSVGRLAPLRVAFLAVTASATLSHAAVQYWIGGNGNWSTPSNWNPAGVPTSASDLVFNATAPNTVTLTDPTSTAGWMAVQAGAVQVAMASNILNVNNQLNVYSSSLTVNGGGEMNVGATAFFGQAATAVFSLSGGTTFKAGGDLFFGNAGGDATVTVSGAGTTLRSVGGYTWVGNGRASTADGSNSTLTLNTGATLNTNLSLLIGSNGGTGKLTADGSGTTVTTANGIDVGGDRYASNVSVASDGQLVVSNGAKVTAPAGVNAGARGGTGAIEVSGNGSSITSLGLSVGQDAYNAGSGLSGNGTLNVSNGGSVAVTNNANIGTTGGVGRAYVDGVHSGGSASTLKADGYLQVGAYRYGTSGPVGDGRLRLGEGAQATIGLGTVVGVQSGTGTVLLDGDNTRLVPGSNGLAVGVDGGTGTFIVQNGAVLDSSGGAAKDAVIGANGGVGTMEVLEPGGLWTHHGNVRVGGNSATTLGTGTLHVFAGGKAVISGSLKVWNGGSTNVTLEGSNSTLSVGSLDLDGDASNLNFTGGTLELAGGDVTGLGSSGNFQTLAVGGTLAGSGRVVGNLSATTGKILAPGTASAAGTLNVDGSVSGNGTALMRLFNATSHGKLVIGGNATLGVIKIELAGGYSPAIGASFDLFDVGGVLSGGYTFDLPALGAGKQWNTSGFGGSGVLAVEAEGAPEPGVTLFAGLAAFGLAGMRRRRPAGERSLA